MGIIYEIICWTTGLRYIGKTTQTLKQRLSHHKCSTKCSSKLILEHGNYEIYELETVEDESLLKEREKYYIQHTDCVNKNTGDFDVKAYKKEYYKEYKKSEKYKEYQKSEKCKENKKLYGKSYREKKKLENSQLK
jgi:hypothetical protein